MVIGWWDIGISYLIPRRSAITLNMSFYMELSSPEIIGGIVPNLIAFTIFCLLIFYFAKTGRMAKMFGWDKHNK